MDPGGDLSDDVERALGHAERETVDRALHHRRPVRVRHHRERDRDLEGQLE
ncbi:MAG: hypothetical protein VYE22_16825 [Myxococcota bacterium]|nr:hypothetical protein [Myxococcota bacterium]